MPPAAALIHQFYDILWNAQAYSRASDILAPGLQFRGSLGVEETGINGFIRYAQSVHAALGSYRCTVLNITEGQDAGGADTARASVRFSGIHRGTFLGVEPTGDRVSWTGDAHFTIKDGVITRIHVDADIDALRASLMT